MTDRRGSALERNPRTVSFLALPDAEIYPARPLMVLLALVAITEGADSALFPSVTKALEETVKYDDGSPFKGSTLGWLAFVQLILQAAAGPTWGIIASRRIMSRKAILAVGTLFQGLATAVMWAFMANTPMLVILRAINGICLAALRPIANSVVGDRFDDDVRGQYFAIIGMSMQLGNAFTVLGATSISRQEVGPIAGIGPVWGWEWAFIAVGAFTAILAPLIMAFLKAPDVKVVEDDGKGSGGIGQELESLARLFKKRSFVVIVFQGCFGLIPWRAFDFRTFFFQTAGLSDPQSATVATSGSFGAAGGNMIGGIVGDALHRCWPHHGRVLAAEISVYGGIPIAYFTFQVYPDQNIAFVYFLSLTIALGLLAAWTEPATINPVLCSLAREEERALILSWQTSLQGAIGAAGPLFFTTLCYYVLGYDARCATTEDKWEDEWGCDPQKNKDAAGLALFLCSCLPWFCCGLLYTSLHVFYPRDIQIVQDENEARAAVETELALPGMAQQS